jgi:hypothetical protein
VRLGVAQAPDFVSQRTLLQVSKEAVSQPLGWAETGLLTLVLVFGFICYLVTLPGLVFHSLFETLVIRRNVRVKESEDIGNRSLLLSEVCHQAFFFTPLLVCRSLLFCCTPHRICGPVWFMRLRLSGLFLFRVLVFGVVPVPLLLLAAVAFEFGVRSVLGGGRLLLGAAHLSCVYAVSCVE